MRFLALLLLGSALLFGCDSSDPVEEPARRPDFRFTMERPAAQDTLRLGEPFEFVAEVEADLEIDSMGVVLRYFLEEEFREVRLDLASFPVERPVGQRVFAVDRTLTVRELNGVEGLDELDPAGQFNIGMYGYSRNSGSEGGRLIVVLD